MAGFFVISNIIVSAIIIVVNVNNRVKSLCFA